MKRRIFLLMCVLAVSLAGCGTQEKYDGSRTEEQAEQSEEENKDMSAELTREEEKLLCDLYTDEDRIKEGKLYGYQVIVLEQIREAREYLDIKYADADLEMISIVPAAAGDVYTTVTFGEKDKDSEAYTLQLEEDAKGDYLLTDNYYGVLIQEEYDQWLSDTLSEKLGYKVVTGTQFTACYGIEINGKMSIEEICELGADLSRNTRIYVSDVSDVDALVEPMKNALKENNLYGSYNLYSDANLFSQGESAGELWDYVSANRNNGTLATALFNCFDLE